MTASCPGIDAGAAVHGCGNATFRSCNNASMVDWDDFRVFLGLQRAGSIHRASQQLRLDVSTVRRRLARLEDGLGARLFRRRRQGLTLTAAGERLLVEARG